LPEQSYISAVDQSAIPAATNKAQQLVNAESLACDAFQSHPLQFKLSVGTPDDPFEKEADTMADSVMRMPAESIVQRKCTQCEEEEKARMKPLASSITPFIQTKSNGEGSASDAVSSQISSSRGNGSQMDRETKTFMESRFGTDFSNVKIHNGKESVQMSSELNAKAFTVGSDIYFNEGQYNTGSESGRHLLAHELTHTLQQGASSTFQTLQRFPITSGDPIHDPILDEYSRDTGIPRDEATQHDPGYEAWLLRSVPVSTPAPTSEENRLTTQSTAIVSFLVPFAAHITSLRTNLSTASTFALAQSVVTTAGNNLWNAATARAQATTGANIDDRPLYWTRLSMIRAIRNAAPGFSITSVQMRHLIDAFEHSSRGLNSVNFSGATSTQKKVLISGFDPFGLDSINFSGTDMSINDSNPSGAAALALDGQTVNGTGGLSAFIQGVVFPVRYRDFDQGIVENLFRPFLNGTTPISMIMTISQGGGSFHIEQSAGRRRSTNFFADNEGVSIGTPASPVVPAGMASATGQEFLPTQLPHSQMSAVPQTSLRTTGATSLNSSGSVVPGTSGTAVTGTGGGFLSNEIFYRVRLLQTTIGGALVNLPVGHLHIPNEDQMTREAIRDRIKQIIAAALPVLP
jgi:pyrrolidone-carboxylate peptidase